MSEQTIQQSETPPSDHADCYLADLDLLLRMFHEQFDWEQWYKTNGASPDEVFRRVAKWHDYRKGNRPVGTGPCGGHEFEDTPKALYRALYLLRPETLDLSDMYKTGTLIDFCSPCYRFECSFQLFKYEACVYFGCAQEFAEGRLSGVQGGWASCNNGVTCNSELGKKWFDVMVKSLERPWAVYPGNDFKV